MGIDGMRFMVPGRMRIQSVNLVWLWVRDGLFEMF